jgi:hypothetical protein
VSVCVCPLNHLPDRPEIWYECHGALMVEAVVASETSVSFYHSTRRDNQNCSVYFRGLIVLCGPQRVRVRALNAV